MAWSAGDRLGRFEILGSLGAGGMGEVYRARDPQLKRDVAIKVLPPSLLDRPDRRRRFEQEARTAGSLSHPNILAVFEIGIEGAVSFIVTELLEGGTLRERMGGRPLSARKAAEYAAQIASGLSAAHDRGVVHRDIKPENVFVTADGRIKILDFGLAKLVGPDPEDDTETVSVDGIDRTPVVGTVAYMSPEQAQGLRIDHRTDIFSLGVVLYEMLSGISPFRRGSTANTLSAILHDEPAEIARVEAGTPTLERIVRRCLEKRPEERFQNARDLAFSLETRSHDTGAVSPVSRRSRFRPGLVAAASLLAVGAAAALGALAALTLAPATADLTNHRARLMTDFVGLEEASSIAPDGKMLAFTAIQGGRSQIFIRFLAGGPPLPLTSDAADHQSPRWLPDGSALVYFSPAAPGEVQGAIHKIPALGGAPSRVIASIGGGDVNSRGRVTCFRLQDDRIQLITSTLEGSDVQVVGALENRYHRYPRWSPDRQWIAFQAGDGFRWDLYVIPAGGGNPLRLTDDNKFISGLTWLPDSLGIVFGSSRGSTVPYLPPLALWEVRLDRKQPPRQLTPAEASYEQPDAHPGGVLAATRLHMRFDIWSYPFASGAAPGRGQPVTRQTGQVLTPTASPDGKQVAYLSDSGGHANIWVSSPQGPPRQITPEDDPTVAIGVPIWSPDGRWIAFVSSRGNVGLGFSVWLVKPDGSELHQLLPKGFGVAWSPDSQWLYYVETAATAMKKVAVTGGEPVTVRSDPVRNVIGVYDTTVYFMVERALLDGRPQYEIHAALIDGSPARVVKTIDATRVASWQVVNPSLSPDGKWLAMPLTDGFTTNIWVLSTGDGHWQPVTDFKDRFVFIARRVSWSPDGKSILAAIGDGDSDIVLLDGLIKGVAR